MLLLIKPGFLAFTDHYLLSLKVSFLLAAAKAFKDRSEWILDYFKCHPIYSVLQR